MRPCYHLVNQATQFSIITVVAALNVEWATDCNRSLTPPIGKTRRNADKIFCASETIHILGSFSQLSRMVAAKRNIGLKAVLCFGRRFLYGSIELACIAHKSLEIRERCRLWQQNSPAAPKNSTAFWREGFKTLCFDPFGFKTCS